MFLGVPPLPQFSSLSLWEAVRPHDVPVGRLLPAAVSLLLTGQRAAGRRSFLCKQTIKKYNTVTDEDVNALNIAGLIMCAPGGRHSHPPHSAGFHPSRLHLCPQPESSAQQKKKLTANRPKRGVAEETT